MHSNNLIEVTVKLDVTNMIKKVKAENLSFQSYLLYCLSKAINKIDNFKYDLVDGELIQWDNIIPTFSAFNEQSKLFYTLCVEMQETYIDFDASYKQTLKQYKDSKTIIPQKTLPANVFNVSVIPGFKFEHFSSNFMMEENTIYKMLTVGNTKK